MWQKLKNYYHFLQSLAAALFFNFPSQKIKVIGVTGTDGKTTTVHMIYEILKESGQKVSMISSVGAIVGSKLFDTGFHVTTPSSWQIQKYLQKAAKAGHRYFVLEATSHGLDQNRLAHVDFTVAVLTNITSDHLDYHRTWENYALSKAKLFKKVSQSVLNYDDRKSFLFLKNRVAGQITNFGLAAGAQINAQNFPLKLKVAGRHNLQNALAAAAAAQILGISRQKIAKALNNFSLPKGRMEEINLGQNFKVIVDFAHTPNGLNQVLTSLKPANSGRLIAVFGAAGQRDRTKRPLMGKIADRGADIIILTAEDPRSEKVSEICNQIASGITAKTAGKNLFKIEDRRKAIEFAVGLASKNDIVGLFGKGHEKSMCFGQQETPWDEFTVAKNAIRKKLKNEN